MPNPILIRQHGWSGRIASLTLFWCLSFLSSSARPEVATETNLYHKTLLTCSQPRMCLCGSRKQILISSTPFPQKTPFWGPISTGLTPKHLNRISYISQKLHYVSKNDTDVAHNNFGSGSTKFNNF